MGQKTNPIAPRLGVSTVWLDQRVNRGRNEKRVQEHGDRWVERVVKDMLRGQGIIVSDLMIERATLIKNNKERKARVLVKVQERKERIERLKLIGKTLKRKIQKKREWTREKKSRWLRKIQRYLKRVIRQKENPIRERIKEKGEERIIRVKGGIYIMPITRKELSLSKKGIMRRGARIMQWRIAKRKGWGWGEGKIRQMKDYQEWVKHNWLGKRRGLKEIGRLIKNIVKTFLGEEREIKIQLERVYSVRSAPSILVEWVSKAILETAGEKLLGDKKYAASITHPTGVESTEKEKEKKRKVKKGRQIKRIIKKERRILRILRNKKKEIRRKIRKVRKIRESSMRKEKSRIIRKKWMKKVWRKRRSEQKKGIVIAKIKGWVNKRKVEKYQKSIIKEVRERIERKEKSE